MKVIKSFAYAFNGIRTCFITQINFKIHALFTTLVIVLGIFFHISKIEWAIILPCIALVICAEIINTAIEKLCDVVHPQFSLKIKIIKDMAAGAVLITALISLITGAFIFLPKIIYYIKSF